jgi:hypothetical protein
LVIWGQFRLGLPVAFAISYPLSMVLMSVAGMNDYARGALEALAWVESLGEGAVCAASAVPQMRN